MHTSTKGCRCVGIFCICKVMSYDLRNLAMDAMCLTSAERSNCWLQGRVRSKTSEASEAACMHAGASTELVHIYSLICRCTADEVSHNLNPLGGALQDEVGGANRLEDSMRKVQYEGMHMQACISSRRRWAGFCPHSIGQGSRWRGDAARLLNFPRSMHAGEQGQA